ncbi:MAG: type II secretion system protein [Verrucomicrobiota bacterium]|jgi:prepilin-type N-terminal cleavage/methylation domain-containing protein|nr:type II secretion system protein [Verrucomicrobiota bacterium]|tara:strand:+ start:5134 stop:5445 length:312 start_codon:yes stop_codon:yes gene_type:complete
MKNRCVRAFTLIELLVVIVVIGLLAGSKSIRCGSNMRQISLSVTMHDDEREGAMPIATNFAEPELSPQRICVTALARFLGNREVFLCPSAEDAQFGGDWVNRS